ncbi:MAG: GNAT family N-acetyltransferase [Cyclobacteriaceae bacterium]|nr:GNAT family N-acetyltransferase [Cyclobacteriaceae bacterium]
MSEPKVIITTQRLVLREFLPSDAKFMFDLNSDPEVIRFTGDEAFKTINEASNLIREYDQYKKYGYGRWTILSKDPAEYLGWCGLNFNRENKETDIGFRLSRNYWGNGFATEAASACLDFGFNQSGLKKIVGKAMKENRNSIHVLEKIGMQFEKEFEAHGGKCVQFIKLKK